MSRLMITEAMPKKVVKLFHILKCLLILGCIVFLVYFVKKEPEIIGEYVNIKAYQEKLSEYKQILQKAKQSYENGKLQESKQLYQQIMSDQLIDTEPYLGLADIFCDSKMYDEALEILEAYPEGNTSESITEKIEEIKKLMESLEQSNFISIQ